MSGSDDGSPTSPLGSPLGRLAIQRRPQLTPGTLVPSKAPRVVVTAHRSPRREVAAAAAVPTPETVLFPTLAAAAAAATTGVMWHGMQQCSDRLENEPPPPQPQQQAQEDLVTGSGVVLSSIPVPAPGAAAGQAQQQARWLSELVVRLGDTGVAGVQGLGRNLTLGQLGEKLGMGAFPGDIDLVALVSGTVMAFTRSWPVTPSTADELNHAVAGLPGALAGFMAIELAAGPKAPPHAQYAYFMILSEAEVAAAATAAAARATALEQPIDAAESRRRGLVAVRRRTARQLGTCLEEKWFSLGDSCHGLLDTGLATAYGPDNAMQLVEQLLVYPWKCIVHLHVGELGLGLGVCTLGMSDAAVAAALGFARCPELDINCLLGSGCSKGHAHCRPRLYITSVGSFCNCVKHAMSLGLRLEAALGVFSMAAGWFGGGQESEAQLAAQFGSGQETEAQLACRFGSGQETEAQLEARAAAQFGSGQETEAQLACRFGGGQETEAQLACRFRSGQETEAQLACRYGGGQETEAQLKGFAKGGRNSSKQEEPVYYSGSGVCSTCRKPTAIERAARCTGKNSAAVAARCKDPACGASNRFSIKKCKLQVWVVQQQEEQEEVEEVEQEEVE